MLNDLQKEIDKRKKLVENYVIEVRKIREKINPDFLYTLRSIVSFLNQWIEKLEKLENEKNEKEELMKFYINEFDENYKKDVKFLNWLIENDQ